ncbi:MAG TPA: alpha/beta family hydrolase [Verrucomicrobiae bacterium]|jgi:predicted alpha/beta-hydrolase family hydrolase|nr:alpha/beta family hydrolase [Verrucomicrobiae bacterium]
MADREALRFAVEGAGEVSALLDRPANARRILVLAHGAGAGMSHPFLEKLTARFAELGTATLRYQFPYMEQRRRIPDRPSLLTATVAAAVKTASELAPGIPLFAGGKSMGGRMTSQAAAEGLLAGVAGLIFFGFPLHPPNRPGTKRADHLADVKLPMLFLQGSRDAFADLKLLRPICAKLGKLATLHVVPDADHSFRVPKKSGKSEDQILMELAETASQWADEVEAKR